MPTEENFVGCLISLYWPIRRVLHLVKFPTTRFLKMNCSVFSTVCGDNNVMDLTHNLPPPPYGTNNKPVGNTLLPPRPRRGGEWKGGEGKGGREGCSSVIGTYVHVCAL